MHRLAKQIVDNLRYLSPHSNSYNCDSELSCNKMWTAVLWLGVQTDVIHLRVPYKLHRIGLRRSELAALALPCADEVGAASRRSYLVVLVGDEVSLRIELIVAHILAYTLATGQNVARRL
jgi:hypothetical protein